MKESIRKSIEDIRAKKADRDKISNEIDKYYDPLKRANQELHEAYGVFSDLLGITFNTQDDLTLDKLIEYLERDE